MTANELRIDNYVSHNSNWFYRGEDIVYFQWSESDWSALGECTLFLENVDPILITEEWLLKFGFENCGRGSLYSNEHEVYDRYVLHNVLDGTSNFEVHNIMGMHGDKYYQQYIISCDEDERLSWGIDIKYVHQLQNLYFALTGTELIIK